MNTPPSFSANAGKRLSFPSSKIAPPPHEQDPDFDPVLAGIASRILFRSGIDPISSGPVYVISAAALPDPKTTDYDRLLPYVLSCLPSDDELADSSLGGGTYSLVLFAGGRADGKTHRPPWGWILQAYYLLGRAVRKKIQRLWIVHERAWIRIILEMLQTVVSPKFRRKIIHVTDLSELSHHINICKLEIPLQVYLHDRKLCPYIQIPQAPPPLFGEPPFPYTSGQRKDEIPIVLTDCSRYLRAYGLRTEGLFRVAASKQILDIAQEAYDRRQRIRMSEFGPHVAAGLVKLYYRSLPTPIIPQRIYEDLEVRFDKNSTASKEETLRILLYNTETNGGLPEDSRKLLTRHLLPLLSLVAAHESDNKMTSSNLAICISASLTRSDDIMRDTELARGPVKLLIQWGIEEFDRLSPALPQRKSSTGVDSEKVIDTPLPEKSTQMPTAEVRAVQQPFRNELNDALAMRSNANANAGNYNTNNSTFTNATTTTISIPQNPPLPARPTAPEIQISTILEPSLPPPIANIPNQYTNTNSNPTSSSANSRSHSPTPPAYRTPLPRIRKTPSTPHLSSSTSSTSTSPFSPAFPPTIATPPTSGTSTPHRETAPPPPPRIRRISDAFSSIPAPPPPPSYAPPKTLRKLSSSSALGSKYLSQLQPAADEKPKPLNRPTRSSSVTERPAFELFQRGATESGPPISKSAFRAQEVLPKVQGTVLKRQSTLIQSNSSSGGTDGPKRERVVRRMVSSGMVKELQALYEERVAAGEVLVKAATGGLDNRPGSGLASRRGSVMSVSGKK